MYYFHPYLGKRSNLTNSFSSGLKPPPSSCKDTNSHGFRQEVASMDISLHETAVAQETVYEVGLVSR